MFDFKNRDVQQQCCLFEIIFFSTLRAVHWSFSSGKSCYINTLFLDSWCDYSVFPLPQQSLSPPVQLKAHTNEQLLLYVIKKAL